MLSSLTSARGTRKINTPSPPEGVEVWKVNYNFL